MRRRSNGSNFEVRLGKLISEVALDSSLLSTYIYIAITSPEVKAVLLGRSNCSESEQCSPLTVCVIRASQVD